MQQHFFAAWKWDAGYSGVMANFHPDLYVWLCKNYKKQPEKAQEP